MSIIQNVIGDIDKGIMGSNRGLNMGYPLLSEYVPNLQRGQIYLVGGESASGKSAFTYEAFVYNPYEDWHKNLKSDPSYKVKFFIWSLEMDKHIVITKAVCRKIYLEHHKLVDVNHVLSRGKNRVSREIYELVKQYVPYYEELEDRVVFMDVTDSNPTGIVNRLTHYMKDNGQEITHPMEITHKDGTVETINKFDRYVPSTENFYAVAIIDHAAQNRAFIVVIL